MKIAVLVYGRLNTCKKHYDNIINNIGIEHEIDFFCSSDNDSAIDTFVKLYKPVLYTNEKTNPYTLDNYTYRAPETNVKNMCSHFMNKMRCYKLLESVGGEKYQVVLSLRIDVLFSSKFHFRDIKENTIYVPNKWDYGGLNDQLAYGTFSSMGKYMNIYKNVENLLNSGTRLHPETLTLANINFEGVNIDRFEIGYVLDK